MMGKQEKSVMPPQEEVRAGKIKARVIDEESGYQKLEGVRAVRLNSSDYRLLIMEDFADTLGRIEGDVTFLLAEREVRLENILGYYKHRHNEFTLLVQEDRAGWYEKL